MKIAKRTQFAEKKIESEAEVYVAGISTPPRKGDRYVVRAPFAADVLTQWRAAFTGGHEQTLPTGLEFVVLRDPPAHATGIAAQPEPYAEWEAKLVNADDRAAEKYSGYYIVVSLAALDANCQLIEPTA